MAEKMGASGDIITYIENLQCSSPTSLRVLFAQRDQLVRQPLCLLSLSPCCRDRFILKKRGNQVAEQGLSMRGLAAQVPVFSSSAGHGGRDCEAGKVKVGGEVKSEIQLEP